MSTLNDTKVISASMIIPFGSVDISDGNVQFRDLEHTFPVKKATL